MTSPCPDDGELAQFVERELPEARRVEIEEHCQGCEACRDAVSYLVEAFAERESLPEVDGDRGALPGKGDALGRYVILDWIGAGAMGAVYSAFDPELDRKVALKLLPPRRGEEGDRLRARFLAEARAMASVSHPNVISVHDVGQHGELAFFAMELVDGQTLSEWSAERSRSVTHIIAVFVDAARGLAAAHARGLVHRDFKPSNALIGNDGRVRVIDFGLARFAAESADTRPPEEEPLELPSPDTRTGTLLGTPAYMAPEQLAGEPSDAAADQFAFCVSVYEALYGRRPFEGGSLLALAESIEKGPSTDASVAVPRRVQRVLARGLSPRPGDRYSSMDALVAALTARPLARWGPTALVAVAMGGLALAVHTAVTGEAGIQCDRDASRLVGVWDETRRAALTDALASNATHDASATTTARWLAGRIDAYADEWTETSHEVCVSTLERHEQSFAMMDRQMMCLKRARAQLRANVDSLIEQGTAEPKTVATFVEGLPALESCRDAKTLDAGPPPPTPVQAAVVESQRDALADARARYLGGDFRGALELAQQVARAALAIDYPPLRYEASLSMGESEYRLSELESAESSLNDALDEALAADDRVIAIRAAATLACLSATELGKPDVGLAYAKTALGLARASEGMAASRAHALRCTARALKLAGHFEEAEQRLREAIATLDAEGEAHDYAAAQARAELGQALLRRRRFAEAAEEFRLARDAYVTLFGAHSVHAIESSAGLASAMVGQGEFASAEQEYARAVELWTRRAGPDAPNIGIVRGKLGNLYYEQDRYEEAEAEYLRAREIVSAGLGADHPTALTIEAALANTYSEQDKLPEAVDTYLDVLARFEPRASPLHPMAVQLRASAANALMQLRRFEEAVDTIEPSVPACTGGKDVPRDLCGDLSTVLARSHLELGHVDEAARHLEDVLSRYGDADLSPNDRDVVEGLKRDLAKARGG